MKSIAFRLAWFAFIAVACNDKPDDNNRHEHGPEPVSYTVYTDKTELFVEFKPLVVGSVSSFATHVTVLGENFVPLTTGSVTVSLVVDDKGIRNTADNASSPGIFRLALQPVKAGTGKLIFDIKAPQFTDRVIIDAIIVYENENAVPADDATSDANEISYLKEQAWRVEFATVAVKRQSFSNVIKTSGMILPAPGDEMVVTSPAAGVVNITGSHAIVGSEVQKGTKLFTITSGDLTQGNIDVAITQARADYQKAKADYERAQELVKDQIISQKAFQQAKLDFENAQTAYNSLAKNYSSSGLSVSSPMDGFLKNIMVTQGQFAEAGTPLATISKNQKLILQANVSQKYFNELPKIQSASFKTNYGEEFYNTENLDGKIISYGKSAAANQPFIPVTFEINNTGNLISGSVAEIYLKTTPIENALVIPSSSLIEEQGIFYVYVQKRGESFEKREVKMGATDGLHVQILNGISEGERVVSKGAYQIKLSSASGTMPAHGHEH